MQITGAVLTKSYDELLNKIERLSSVCDRIQIDLSDGRVGKELSWLPYGYEILPHTDHIEYEFHFMIQDWRSVLDKVLLLNPGRIVLHIDTFTLTDCRELAERFSSLQLPLGLSSSNELGLEDFKQKINTVKEYYENIYLQVMGIENVGEQGQVFDEKCLDRIKELKKTYGEIFLQVDGAMHPGNIEKVLRAGADGIVVGSYLLRNDDIGEAMRTLASIE